MTGSHDNFSTGHKRIFFSAMNEVTMEKKNPCTHTHVYTPVGFMISAGTQSGSKNRKQSPVYLPLSVYLYIFQSSLLPDNQL